MQDRTAAQDAFYQRLKPEGKRLMVSVDGGGTKGYITLHCLSKLEDLTGRPCHDIFDFYAGTSTGSLIAAGLAVGMSAHALLDLYKNRISDVFDDTARLPFLTETGIALAAGILRIASKMPPKQIDLLRNYARLLARNRWRYMYSNERLRALASDFLRDPNGNLYTLADFYRQSVEQSGGQHTKRVFITIVDVQRGETLFVVNAGPGAAAIESMTLVDAAVASSVAPVFLQPYKVWVDGGVGNHANPCYEALVEATEYFTGLRAPAYTPKDDDLAYLHDNVIHLSFGTAAQPSNTLGETAIQSMLFLDWLLYVMFHMLEHANNDQVRLTEERFSRGNNWYSDAWNHKKVDFRRYQIVLDPALLARPVSADGLGLALTAAEAERLSALEMNSSAPEDLALMARLGEAWADAIGENFARPHYPYVDHDQAYTPPASPVIEPHPPLVEHVQRLIGDQVLLRKKNSSR
jgi:predicted acylesterase/phospholipase RssA